MEAETLKRSSRGLPRPLLVTQRFTVWRKIRGGNSGREFADSYVVELTVCVMRELGHDIDLMTSFDLQLSVDLVRG